MGAISGETEPIDLPSDAPAARHLRKITGTKAQSGCMVARCSNPLQSGYERVSPPLMEVLRGKDEKLLT